MASKRLVVDIKKRLSKIKVGLNCIIHVKSKIFEEYFLEYGQPIKPENMHSACFEGKVVSISRDIQLSDKSRQLWAIHIPALYKHSTFYVDASAIDQYFCEDFTEPDGWESIDKKEMETLYRIYEAKQAWIKELNTPTTNVGVVREVDADNSTLHD